MNCIIAVTIFSAFILLTEGRIYNRCDLARDIRSFGVSNRREIATWVCIANFESTFNTAAVNPSGFYGLFQIGSQFWCSPPGQGCGIPCRSLIDDNIADDFRCARKIFDITRKEKGDGFLAWDTYSRCRNPDRFIAGCGI